LNLGLNLELKKIKLDTIPQKVYYHTQKGDIVSTARLNIALVVSPYNDINRYTEELNEKKSYTIVSTLKFTHSFNKELLYHLKLCSYGIVYEKYKARLLILALYMGTRRRYV